MTSAVEALSALPLGPHAPSEVLDASSACAVDLAVWRGPAASAARRPKIASAAPLGLALTSALLKRPASLPAGLPYNAPPSFAVFWTIASRPSLSSEL